MRAEWTPDGGDTLVLADGAALGQPLSALRVWFRRSSNERQPIVAPATLGDGTGWQVNVTFSVVSSTAGLSEFAAAADSGSVRAEIGSLLLTAPDGAWTLIGPRAVLSSRVVSWVANGTSRRDYSLTASAAGIINESGGVWSILTDGTGAILTDGTGAILVIPRA